MVTKQNFDIVELPPMRVAAFHAFGTEPEPKAHELMEAWTKPRGLSSRTVYGFNNPSPEQGDTEYGYEIWVQLEPEDDANGATLKEFPGGRYAVARFWWKDEDVPAAWQKLYQDVTGDGYALGTHQWLEREFSVPEGDGLDLMFPLA